MAIHADLRGLVAEALAEYLQVAEHCANYAKNPPSLPSVGGPCLGFPAAVLLFVIADAIGSFCRGNEQVKIPIDGKLVPIRKDSEHFFILNSDYYAQTLDRETINALYKNFRCLLLHNAALAPAHFLVNIPGNPIAFPVVNGRPGVNVPSFLHISKLAVSRFLGRLDELLPRSAQARNIEQKNSDDVI
jgi:hypothetical protein